jgi:hypothetical protein
MTQKPNKPGTKARLVEVLGQNAAGKFAVFGRTPSGTRAYFRTVHDDISTAIEAAQTHAAENAAAGKPDFTFYVVEIKHRYGIENGKVVM